MEEHGNTGKKNAEKWTDETVSKVLDSMLDTIKVNKCYYVGWLLDDHDLYPDWWAYIKGKESLSPDIGKTMRRIEQKLERNLLQAMLQGDVKETTGIFTLKSKHGWVDKTQHDHKVDPITINLNLK